MKFFAIFAAFIAVAAAAPVQTWTLQEISAALQNPNTDPALIPQLEQGLNLLMEALFAGIQVDTVAIPVPAEIAIQPVPVVVAEEATPAQAASTPLVQIIVNVQQQEQVVDVPVPSPEPSPVPSPVIVPEIIPTPVIVVDQPSMPIDVSPIVVPEIVPEPVIVAPVDVNPIDVIAVGAIENNPIDILNPIPVNPAAVEGILV